MSICEDLKVGGTVGAASITGGTSVSNHALMVADYSSLWGIAGKRATPQPVIGQPGSVISGKELPDVRILTLSLRATDLTTVGGAPTATNLWANQDTLTSLFTASGGVVIEWILPTESRWIRAWALTSSPQFIQGGKYRLLAIPLTAPWPYWRSDTEQSVVVNGAAVAAGIGGTVERIYDPSIVFSGDGVFTDDTSGGAGRELWRQLITHAHD